MLYFTELVLPKYGKARRVCLCIHVLHINFLLPYKICQCDRNIQKKNSVTDTVTTYMKEHSVYRFSFSVAETQMLQVETEYSLFYIT